MKFTGLILSFTLLFPLPGYACLQESEESEYRAPQPVESSYSAAITEHAPPSHWESVIRQVSGWPDVETSAQAQNDLAAAEVHLGQYKEAFARLDKLEASQPGHYSTAANLGTVHELLGNLPNALHWIKESIRRNPNSHHGTEWLHVRILECKLLAQPPVRPTNLPVSGADFGKNPAPAMPIHWPSGNSGKPVSRAEFEKALQYQLHERTEFVRAPDTIVADLLFDLGNALAIDGQREHAASVYRLSATYQPSNLNLLNARVQWLNQKPKYGLYALGTGILLVLGTLLWSRLRRKSEDTLPVQKLENFKPL